MKNWQTTAFGVAILVLAAVMIICAPQLLEKPEGQGIIATMILAGGGLVRASDASR